VNIPDWSWRGFDDRTNTAGTFTFRACPTIKRPAVSFVQQAGNGHVTYLERVIGLFIRMRCACARIFRSRQDCGTTGELRPRLSHRAARVSMAFAPGGSSKLVIRGGTGLFYDRIGPNPVSTRSDSTASDFFDT
jgi:hypothetical protein